MTMTPHGARKMPPSRRSPPSPIPAVYGDMGQTPLREVVPATGKIELALRSKG